MSPVDALLRLVDERIQCVLEGREPEAVVDQLGPTLLHLTLVATEFAFEGDVFEFLVRGDENHGAGSFVDLTALDAHETVLDDVEATDALSACALVQFLDGFENRHRAAVDGDRAALVEADDELVGCVSS